MKEKKGTKMNERTLDNIFSYLSLEGRSCFMILFFCFQRKKSYISIFNEVNEIHPVYTIYGIFNHLWTLQQFLSLCLFNNKKGREKI